MHSRTQRKSLSFKIQCFKIRFNYLIEFFVHIALSLSILINDFEAMHVVASRDLSLVRSMLKWQKRVPIFFCAPILMMFIVSAQWRNESANQWRKNKIIKSYMMYLKAQPVSSNITRNKRQQRHWHLTHSTYANNNGTSKKLVTFQSESVSFLIAIDWIKFYFENW